MADACFRGGPKDGAVLSTPLSSTDYVAFDETPPWARYKMTSETVTRDTVTRDGVVYPVAIYVGTGVQPLVGTGVHPLPDE